MEEHQDAKESFTSSMVVLEPYREDLSGFRHGHGAKRASRCIALERIYCVKIPYCYESRMNSSLLKSLLEPAIQPIMVMDGTWKSCREDHCVNIVLMSLAQQESHAPVTDTTHPHNTA